MLITWRDIANAVVGRAATLAFSLDQGEARKAVTIFRSSEDFW